MPRQAYLPIELSVGDVARRSGLAVSALHFYEAEGLIRSHRTAGNQRRYAREVLRRVAIIKVDGSKNRVLGGGALSARPEAVEMM